MCSGLNEVPSWDFLPTAAVIRSKLNHRNDTVPCAPLPRLSCHCAREPGSQVSLRTKSINKARGTGIVPKHVPRTPHRINLLSFPRGQFHVAPLTPSPLQAASLRWAPTRYGPSGLQATVAHAHAWGGQIAVGEGPGFLDLE